MRFFGTMMSLAGAVALAFMPVAEAKAMTVQPVVINLTTYGTGMSRTVQVENTFSTRLPVELKIEELRFEDDKLVNTHADPGDLLVFPPQAFIEPGQTQTFRIQYVGDPELAQSKYYYVTVAQLPVKLPDGQSAIQILYNFQVLVSIAPAGVKPALEIVSAQVGKGANGKPVPEITIANPSNAHGYLSDGRLRIEQFDASGKSVFKRTISGPEMLQIVGFGLVGANGRRTITIPVELPTSEGTVDAKFMPQ